MNSSGRFGLGLVLATGLVALLGSCGQVRQYCENAPCPSLSGSHPVQPQPVLIGAPLSVRRGEVLRLKVSVDLGSWPQDTVLTWLDNQGGDGDTVLLDVPSSVRVTTDARSFRTQTTLTFTVAPDAPLGYLNTGGYALGLRRAQATDGSFSSLSFDFKVEP